MFTIPTMEVFQHTDCLFLHPPPSSQSVRRRVRWPLYAPRASCCRQKRTRADGCPGQASTDSAPCPACPTASDSRSLTARQQPDMSDTSRRRSGRRDTARVKQRFYQDFEASHASDATCNGDHL